MTLYAINAWDDDGRSAFVSFGGSAFGSNVAALETVGRRKGYTLVHTDLTGTNAFFVRDDLVGAVGVDRAPRRSQNFGLTGISQSPSDPPGGWTTIT